MSATDMPENTNDLMGKISQVEEQLNSVILGREELIRFFISGMLAGGHILLEGLPGLGKTQMVRAFSMLCDLISTRIQFTPDLMPLDITGSNILRDVEGGREFEFHPGPVFGNLVLADEINRASPKTQSALLEAMQEGRVTVLGTTHPLPAPFAVLATQNPIELEGTYPLPEAQLDRFLFKLEVTDVSAEIMTRIITELDGGVLPELDPVLSREDFLQAMAAVKKVELSSQVASYIGRLVTATHPDGDKKEEGPCRFIKFGASPRAAIGLASASRALAFMDKRDTVGFEDVKAVAPAILRHRLILDYAARLEGLDQNRVVAEILETTPEITKDQPESVMERIAAGAGSAG